MLSSAADMTWHHPVSSDRQHDLQLDPYATTNPHHQQSAHPQHSPVTPHHPQHPGDWDIFASPVAFVDPINGLDVNAPPQHTPAVPAAATGNPMREPSYDLFSAAPNSFGPTTRFRSDSSASSSYNTNPAHPTASPTTGSYGDYLYGSGQPAGQVSSPSSAHSTRPPSASFAGGYPPTNAGPGTISPDAVGPPSFAELMVDRGSSAPSAGPEYSPYNAFAQPPHQQGLGAQAPGAPAGTRFQMSPYDLASPPQQHQYIQPQQQQQRPGLPHSSRSMPAVYNTNGTASSATTTSGAMPTSPFSSGAFDPSATLAASAPLVKREDVPFNFATSSGAPGGVPFSTNPHQGDGNDLQSFIRFLCPPPTAVMLGNHWWHETRRGEYIPPKAVISISGEPSPLESLTEWSTPLGKNFDVSDPPAPGTTTYMGRCIGKQLFITDYDDRKKKVEALVRVVQPADEQEGEPERLLGVFPSKPIKVISKPSKKRQSAKNLEYSFVIYIVDVNKQTDPNAVPPPPPHPEYPSPPPNAIPYNTNGAHMYTPIYYNQTVVLQCLISGVVSPVLIIRKVDHGTIAVGGGLADGVKGVPNHYCAPGEVCGDPVSQLHKIALEVYEPAKAGSAATMDPNHPGTSGSFLSCMGERVNTYRPSEDRQWNGHHGGDSSSGTPSPSLPGSPIQSPISAGANGVPDYFGAMGGGSGASTPGMDYPGSSDGGRVRPSRAQKRSSLNLPASKGGSAKNRRRVNSASGARDEEGGKKSTASSGALWSVNIGETAIWTVVGTDQVRYDFYIPPTIFNSSPSGYPLQSQTSSTMASSPSALAQPITPAPSVVKYLPPERAQELPKCPSNSRASSMKMDQGAASKMLTLYGENFNKGDPVSVWFGSEPSPHTEVRCTEVINCLPPPSGPLSHYPRPIVLVRGDGVVFPTKVMYP
ncbi:hypothetical protein FRC01_001595 [Tulasnella sp. 417]|nr:hypothetical protein FRC01_001595 [Tulasnella sp. 417]